MGNPIENVTNQVTQQGMDAGRGLLGGLFHALVGGPIGMAKGVFGGLWNGLLWFGVPLTAISLLVPQALTPFVALFGKDAVDKFANLGTRADGTQSILPRIIATMGAGAALGGAFGGIKGGINGVTNSFSGQGDAESHGNNLGALVAGGGLAIVVASVMMGAVKNGGIKLADNGASGPVPPTVPSKSTPSVKPTVG